MEQTVYADLFFLINFSMDFLCLFLTSKLLSRTLSLLRAVSAATLGGIYAVAELLLLPDGAAGLFLSIGFCVFMCLVAFWRKGERITGLLLLSGSYILASALLGGIMTAVFSLLNRYAPPPETESADIPVWIFVLVTLLSALATLFGGRHLRKRATITTARVKIDLGGHTVDLGAMSDSGNLLRDPVSGKQVLLIDTEAAAPLFSHLGGIPAVESITALPPALAPRARLIPTSSVGGERMIVAFRPDGLWLTDSHGTHTVDALVGLADLSHAPPDHKAILPPELIS